MQLAIDQKDIDKFLMVGDKVLIKPKNPQSQTKSGLYLPPSWFVTKVCSNNSFLFGKILCYPVF